MIVMLTVATAMLRLSRTRLRLFHGNLIDVRQCPGARGSLDRFYSDVLDLLFCLVKLLLQCRHLCRLARDALLERLDLEL